MFLPSRRSLLPLHILSLTLSILLSLINALTTVKIDDQTGDPVTGVHITYSPDGVWSYGPTCGGCSSKPDPSEAYDGSWHDGAYFPRDDAAKVAQVFFTGTAVNVFGILSHGSSGAASDITFYIDGVQKYHYSQSDIDGNGFVYNYSFFSTSSLEFAQHNLTIVNGGNLGQSTSLLLLDYIEYSYDETASSFSNNQPASPNSIVDKVGSPPSTSPSGPGSTTTTTTSTSSSSTTTDSRSSTFSSNTTTHPSTNTTQPTGTPSPHFSNGSFASSGTDSVSPASTSPADTNTSTSPSTSSSSSSSSSKKSDLGLIIGSTLGALAFLSILILSLILALRTRRRRNESRREILLPRPLSESIPSNSVPPPQETAEKASLSHPSNPQTDTDRDGDESSSQDLSQTISSDATRSRMINDVFTLAAEVQRLVGEIGRDGHGNVDGGGEGEGEGAGEVRETSLPPPYS